MTAEDWKRRSVYQTQKIKSTHRAAATRNAIEDIHSPWNPERSHGQASGTGACGWEALSTFDTFGFHEEQQSQGGTCEASWHHRWRSERDRKGKEGMSQRYPLLCIRRTCAVFLAALRASCLRGALPVMKQVKKKKVWGAKETQTSCRFASSLLSEGWATTRRQVNREDEVPMHYLGTSHRTIQVTQKKGICLEIRRWWRGNRERSGKHKLPPYPVKTPNILTPPKKRTSHRNLSDFWLGRLPQYSSLFFIHSFSRVTLHRNWATSVY